jgi:cysteine-S-conjugate beta-lyase
MAQGYSLDRRSFLRNAGLAALAGAVGPATDPVGAVTRVAAGSGGAPPAGRFDFDTVYSRFGTECIKYDQQIRTYGKGSIQVGLGIADMDFRAAPCITKALQERIGHENWGYLDLGAAGPAMAESIAAWNKRHYGVTIDPATVVLTTGVHPALIFAIQAFSPRGGKVLLTTPAYDGFYSDLDFTGTIAEESPMKFENGRYRFDYEDFERRIGHDTHTFILCNPHNPTGNCWSAEELTKIGEICLRRRVVVLADEIHCDFMAKGQKHTPFASLPNKAIVDNSLTFNAASKSFNVSSHKVGWFYSTNPDLLASVKPYVRADLTTLGIVANRAAYAEGDEWLNQAAAYIDANRDFVASYVHDRIPSVKVTKGEGTYLCWLDVSELMERIGARKLAEERNRTKAPADPKRTPEEMTQRYLVERAKVHINPGSAYGKGGAGHMRMNIATSRKLLELALGNIAAAVKNL